MKVALYIMTILCICASVYIGYIELTSHNHIKDGIEDLNHLQEIISHADGEQFIIPLEEATDFIHALTDLGNAISPMAIPIIGIIAYKRKGKNE